MDDAVEGPDDLPAKPAGALTEVEESVLAFAVQRWKYPGAMEAAVREEFDWSLTRYYQVLNDLLDRPEATAHAPMLVGRLRRLRDARAEQRSARRGLDALG